jgi:pimeloyl-ACP methyl ester carboxylesterase
VPKEVIAADDAAGVAVPRELAWRSLSPNAVTTEASTIDVPVFVGLGERDVSPDPEGEPALFPASPSVTLYVLPGSAHCHNFATTRHKLWDRLASWVASTA